MTRALHPLLVAGVLAGLAHGCAPSAPATTSPPPPTPTVDMVAPPPPPPPPVDQFVRGIVTSGGKPVVDARLRIQGSSDAISDHFVVTSVDGSFNLPLPGRKAGDKLVVTVAHRGFRTGMLELPPTGKFASIELTPLAPDNDKYVFIAAAAVDKGCATCHTAQAAAWGASQHAASARDPLVFDEQRRHLAWWQRLDPATSDAVLYAGPMRPADDKGDIGKVFHEGDYDYRILSDSTQVDDCAKCHSPGYAMGGGIDLRPATMAKQPAVFSEGVTCDVCHKIGDVDASNEGALVSAGIDKVTFARPAAGAPVTSGPLDDVISPDMPTTYAPIFAQSEYCSACHSDARALTIQQLDAKGQPAGPPQTRNIWGEDTYREWRFRPGSALAVEPIAGGTTYAAAGDGPYTGPGNYAGRALSCQDCHMADPPQDPSTGERIAGWQDPTAGDGLLANRKDAIKRDPTTIHSHRMEGRTARYIAWAVDVAVDAQRQQDGTIAVKVLVENRHTGHSFPSGLPDRNALLVIEATDGLGALKQLSGPVVPGWASGDGKSDPARDLAGRPGRGYARLVADVDSKAPVFYLRGVKGAGGADYRILPGFNDSSSYVFGARPGPTTIRVRVLHRLRFKVQTDQYLAAHKEADPGMFETVGDVVEVKVP